MNSKDKFTLYRPVNPNGLQPGDRVHFNGWGGEVRLIDEEERGVVVRLNRNGHPVILIEKHSHETQPRTLTDRYGCARKTKEENSDGAKVSGGERSIEEIER